MDTWKTPVGKIRISGALEGFSFVVLMLIGLPLKYGMGIPEVVKVTGPIHGMLLMWLWYQVAGLVWEQSWGYRRGAIVCGASLLPFGPFLIDGWLKQQPAPIA